MGTRDFSQLSTVAPGETGGTAFLTIDIDWAEDKVLNDTIDLVEKADVEATWFITHQTAVLDRLRENPKFELGIHPNFNFLLEGDTRNGGNFREVIERLLDVVPGAKSLRSHSLCTSTKLLQLMPEYGLTHESNTYIPWGQEPAKPFQIWNDVVRVAHSFEDDLFLLESDERGMLDGETMSGHVRKYHSAADRISVFDFHPIHVFLNTNSIERYESTRSIHRQHDELIKHRFEGDGARLALRALLGLC